MLPRFRSLRGVCYRLRTEARGYLPSPLLWMAPKGKHDCGRHEWYRADPYTLRCYHCEPGLQIAQSAVALDHIDRITRYFEDWSPDA